MINQRKSKKFFYKTYIKKRNMNMKISAINYSYNFIKPIQSKKIGSFSYEQDTISFSSRRKKKKNKTRNILGFIGAGIVTIGGIGFLTPSKPVDTTPPIGIYADAETPEEEFQQEEIQIKPSAQQIIENMPEIKEQYDKITNSLNLYSEQLGENALPLIKKRIEQIGNNRVELLDVLKVLYIESNGNIYDKDGSILTSKSGAFGAFQVTKDTEDFINNYFKTDLDVKNPYDNLDACIYNLRFIQAKRSEDIETGIELPTGNNLKHAIMWSYHDGAWAERITNYGQDYLVKYDKLSQIDKFPQVVDLILNAD